MSARVVGLLLWLGIGGVAVAAVLWQLKHPPQPPASAAAASRSPELPTVTPLNPFRLPPLENYGEAVDRPLFIATRRPEPPPPAEAALEKPAPPPGLERKFLLMGVMIAPSSTVALLRPIEPNAKSARVKLGETINDWQLEAIFPDRVVLRQGQATQELPLTHPPKPPKPRSNPTGAASTQGAATPAKAPNAPPPQGNRVRGVAPPQPGALPPSVIPVPPQGDGKD